MRNRAGEAQMAIREVLASVAGCALAVHAARWLFPTLQIATDVAADLAGQVVNRGEDATNKAHSANAEPIRWKYSDPTRRIRNNELTCDSPLARWRTR
jgi:hypothetical protein